MGAATVVDFPFRGQVVEGGHGSINSRASVRNPVKSSALAIPAGGARREEAM